MRATKQSACPACVRVMTGIRGLTRQRLLQIPRSRSPLAQALRDCTTRPRCSRWQPACQLHSGVSDVKYDDRPFIAIWEITQACDLVCEHCRACAQPLRDQGELTTEEGFALLQRFADARVPL